MKVIVIGANGQLGSDLVNIFSDKSDVLPLTHEDIEITNIERAGKVLENIKPDVVLNTAAYHNVPKCEDDPQTSFAINGLGALNLAKLSEKQDFRLVHYSTDYVFDGLKKQLYTESDCPNPLNVYAATKLDGENYVRNYCDKHFIIRVAGIYGKTPCRAKGGNFIDTMVRLAGSKPKVTVVNDEILTPTATEEIARNTFDLMQTEAYGLYHMTAQEEVSWYAFARVIFDELNLKTPLEACSVSDFPSPVKRPAYSALENANLKEIGLDNMAHWETALRHYLRTGFLAKG